MCALGCLGLMARGSSVSQGSARFLMRVLSGWAHIGAQLLEMLVVDVKRNNLPKTGWCKYISGYARQYSFLLNAMKTFKNINIVGRMFLTQYLTLGDFLTV